MTAHVSTVDAEAGGNVTSMSVVPTDALSPLFGQQVEDNKRRATLMVIALFTVVAAGILLLATAAGAPLVGLAAGVLLATALAVAASRKSTAAVLAKTRARPADEAEFARLHNLVEGLCAGFGLPKPGVYVVDDDALNAFAAGRNPHDAVIAVTTGLTTNVSRIELEGVLAHLLSRVKNLDILPSTLAVTLVGPLSRVLPPAQAGRLLDAAVGTRRESQADLTAVALTRYPPGLIAALEKLDGASTLVQPANRATAHLWMVNAPLKERIAALREL